MSKKATNQLLESNLIPISPSGTEDELMSSLNYESKIVKKDYQKVYRNDMDNQILEAKNSTSNINDKELTPNPSYKKNPHLIYSKYDLNKKSNKRLTNNQIKKEHYLEDSNLSDISNRKFDSHVQKLSAEITDLKKQMYKIRQDNLNLQEENGFVKLEKEKLLKIKNNEIALLNEKLVTSDQNNKKLTNENEMKSKQLDEYTPKIWKYDELNDKFQNLSKENDKLLTSNNNLNELLTNLKKENNENSSKFEILKLENDNLKQDKIYLSKTNMLNEQKIKDQTDKIKQLESEMIDVRKKNQDYIEKLTNKNISLDNTYKDKVNSELDAMKAKYDKDIQSLKAQYDELTEKKTNYLKEERDEYKNKCRNYEQSIKDKDETINMISSELRNFQTKTNEELSNVKLQLNIKTEELNSRNGLYEENLQALTLLRNDYENVKEKNDLLRSELIKKESQLSAEVANYKAQLSVLKEKINSYENIENELDKAICQNALDKETNSEIINIIKDIPTSSKRRISQCLALANKVKLLTIDNEKLNNLNQQLNNDLVLLKDQNEIYKNVAEKTKQPYSYLIKNLQDNELEIFKLKQEIEKKDQVINRLNKENELYQEKVDALGSDLKAIVGNRQQLTNLENVITSFLQNDNSNKINGTNTINSNYNNNYSMMANPGTTLNMMSNTNFSNNIGNISNLSMNMNNVMSNQPEKDITNYGSCSGNINNFNSTNTINNKSQAQFNNSNGKLPSWYLKLQAKKQSA